MQGTTYEKINDKEAREVVMTPQETILNVDELIHDLDEQMKARQSVVDSLTAYDERIADFKAKILKLKNIGIEPTA